MDMVFDYRHWLNSLRDQKLFFFVHIKVQPSGCKEFFQFRDYTKLKISSILAFMEGVQYSRCRDTIVLMIPFRKL